MRVLCNLVGDGPITKYLSNPELAETELDGTDGNPVTIRRWVGDIESVAALVHDTNMRLSVMPTDYDDCELRIAIYEREAMRRRVESSKRSG
jgi:hypothetical protein